MRPVHIGALIVRLRRGPRSGPWGQTYTHACIFGFLHSLKCVLRRLVERGNRKKRKKHSRSQCTLWDAEKFSLGAADETAGVNRNCWQRKICERKHCTAKS